LTQDLVLPPHNIDAEEAVLGSLLISPDAFTKIDGMLKPCDFYSERNRQLYGARVSLRGRSAKINQATVAQQVNAARSLAGPAGGVRVVPRGRCADPVPLVPLK
jgi:replicative DNA helicase